MNLVEIPEFKKVNFQTVESMYEIFEKPIKEIGITRDNTLKEFDKLRNHYQSDYLFFYHICWEMILLVDINYESLDNKDKKFLDNFHKERSPNMKPYHQDMYGKMFDKVHTYLIRHLSNQTRQ